jgi:hypothetical protein
MQGTGEMRPLAELGLIRRAIKSMWPIPPEQYAYYVQRVYELAHSEDPRVAMKAISAAVAMGNSNLREQEINYTAATDPAFLRLEALRLSVQRPGHLDALLDWTEAVASPPSEPPPPALDAPSPSP